jgi:ADP-heptose:LPS heptosyltransferase
MCPEPLSVPRPSEARSIVAFRALQLGDLLCAIPAFRALRIAYPESRITLAGLPWAHTLVGRYMHYLDDFVAFPGTPELPEQRADVAALPGFFADMRARRFDLAVQLHGSGEHTNAIVAEFKAARTVGFRPNDRAASASRDFLDYPDEGHEIRRMLRLLEFVGVPAQGEELEFPLYDDDYQELRALAPAHTLEPGSYVCLHPGSRDAAKRWPARHFAKIGEALHEAGYRIVLTGSGAERPLTTAIARAMRAPSINCAAPVSIGALAALLNNARLLVTNDTGVSHVAAALRLPSVVIFTATDPARWAPLDANLHRVVHDPARNNARRVLECAMQLLRETWAPGNDHGLPGSRVPIGRQRVM